MDRAKAVNIYDQLVREGILPRIYENKTPPASTAAQYLWEDLSSAERAGMVYTLLVWITELMADLLAREEACTEASHDRP